MNDIKIHKIAMLFTDIFLIYIFWFQYVYGEKRIILYGTVLVATFFTLYDMLNTQRAILDIFPIGVLINLIMCVYSIIVGAFIATDQEVLVSAVKTYMAFSLVCLVICYVSDCENSIEWLANTFIFICIIISFFILFRGYYCEDYGYVLGPQHNPNTLGVTMDLGIFCVAFKLNAKRRWPLIYYGLIVLFVYIIIGCGSRKSLIAALLVILTWLIPTLKSYWKRGNWIRHIVLLCMIIILIIAAVYYYQNVYIHTDSYKRMENLGSAKEGSSLHRKQFYQFAIDFFLESPFLGIGLDQFRVMNPYHGYSHSTYAEAIADWGGIGCVIYFMPVIWAGYILLKKSVFESHTNKTKTILALFVMEIFLGIGQIWFYEIEHLTAWTIIFLFLRMNPEEKGQIGRQYKYVKV